MEQTVKRLHELTGKKLKISKKDSLEATELLYKIYNLSNKDSAILVDYLHDFYYKISGMFIGEYYFELNKGEKDKIVQSFIQNEKFMRNMGSSSIYKGFSIITEMIRKDIEDENILLILVETIKVAGKNNEFNDTSCKIFMDFLEKNNDMFFNLDFSLLSDDELMKLYQYINITIPDISTILYGDKIKSWSDKYFSRAFEKHVLICDDLEGEGKTSDGSAEETKMEELKEEEKGSEKLIEIDYARELLEILQSANQEVSKLLNNVFIKNHTIGNLQDKLYVRFQEINQLKEEIENKNTSLSSLNNTIDSLKKDLDKKEEEIKDLRGRLKLSFDADEVSKNQELMTLKNDIALSVKLQYADFNEQKNENCNEDNYEALKVILNQVFRILKRYGIEL